jgi:hypothetical protein
VAHYIRAAVKGSAADDGLIQRFGLLIWPDTGGAWREVDRWPISEARRQASAQAAAVYRIPCLAYREDRQGWLFVVPMQELHRDMPAATAEGLDYCATLTLLGWAALVREGGAV